MILKKIMIFYFFFSKNLKKLHCESLLLVRLYFFCGILLDPFRRTRNINLFIRFMRFLDYDLCGSFGIGLKKQ